MQKFKADHKIPKDKERLQRLKDTHLTIEFPQKAELVLVKHSQRENLHDEINLLSCDKDNTQLLNRSPLWKLIPSLPTAYSELAAAFDVLKYHLTLNT